MLNTPIGQTLISILLGIGLATMFREVCEGKNCIVFNGPVISEIDGKTYKYDDYCYKYELASVKCNPAKRIIETSKEDEGKGILDPVWGGLAKRNLVDPLLAVDFIQLITFHCIEWTETT